MSNNALTVENLNKIYSNSKTKKEIKAITDLTFEVKEGEVFGLLGPNGAGKTTFLSILGGTVSKTCLLYTSPSPRDREKSRMPSSA